MRVDDVYLAGVGSYLPAAVPVVQAVDNGWWDDDAATASGITAVRVAGDVPAPELAVRAAAVAVRRSGHDADDFGAVLHSSTYHQGPDGWSAPHYVLRHALNRPISAVEVRQGCLGMIAGLQMAAHLVTADRGHEAVLLTAGDNFGAPLVDRWRASRLFVLADAGAAVVVSRRAGFARVRSFAAVSDPRMEELHRGGEALFPPGVTVGRGLDFEERTGYWRRQWATGAAPPMGNFGDCVADAAQQALDEAGIEKVARVCHVGYARGPLQAMLLDPLGIDAEQGVWDITREIGHAGAADPFLALERLWTDGSVTPGDHLLLIGATPGMEAGCAVIEIIASYQPEGGSAHA